MQLPEKFIVTLTALALIVGGGIVLKNRGAGSESNHSPAVYYCPMHPAYTSDRPGDCPICNMKLVKKEDLVPVYEDAPEKVFDDTTPSPEGYTPILVTPQKQRLMGVASTPVERRTLTKTIRAVGTIAHDPDLYEAQSEYIQAMQAWQRSRASAVPEIIDQSKRLLESTRIRLKHLGLSDDLIVEIAAWKEPDHGLLFSHPGDPVWMYAQVYEYELPMIKTGQRLSVDVPSLPGETFPGVIRAIDLMVDPVTRTTRIRALLQDPAGHLKPDMYVNVSIAVDLGDSLVVPEEAVFNTGARQIVFVDKEEGFFEPRQVVLGERADHFYQIKSGVAEGERVVTSGNFLIDSESRLKSALEGMSGGAAGEGGHRHGQ